MPAKPTFLGIGAQKCASTWLYDILSDHPQACLAAEKELDFFSHRFDFGFQWYERQFHRCEEHKAVGEVSPSYFHGAGVPRRVYEYDRAMRLILFLRDPIDRAISNHKHEVRTGHLAGHDLSFEFGLENNPSYIEQGLYATHLERWLECFSLNQILVVMLDDIVSDPAEVARTVYRFLKIDDTHVARAVTSRANESYLDRFRWLAAARRTARHAVRRAKLDWLWHALGKMGARRFYRSLNRAAAESVIPPMHESTRARLRQKFEPEVRRLEETLGRSLAGWLKPLESRT